MDLNLANSISKSKLMEDKRFTLFLDRKKEEEKEK